MNKLMSLSAIILASACMTMGLNLAFADTNSSSKASAQKTTPAHTNGMKKLEEKLAKLKKELTLSDEQTQKVREIMKDAHDKMNEELKTMHDEMKAMHEKMSDDIRDILNDKQKTHYDKMKAERQAKHAKKTNDKNED